MKQKPGSHIQLTKHSILCQQNGRRGNVAQNEKGRKPKKHINSCSTADGNAEKCDKGDLVVIRVIKVTLPATR